jgi:hypothetical protein
MSVPNKNHRSEGKSSSKKAVRFQANKEFFNLDGSKVNFNLVPSIINHPLPYHRLQKLFHSGYVLRNLKHDTSIPSDQWNEKVSEICELELDAEVEKIEKAEAFKRFDVYGAVDEEFEHNDKSQSAEESNIPVVVEQKEAPHVKDFDSLYKRLNCETNSKPRVNARQIHGGKFVKLGITLGRLNRSKDVVTKQSQEEKDREEDYDHIEKLLPNLFKKYESPPKIEMKHVKEFLSSSSEDHEHKPPPIVVKSNKRVEAKPPIIIKSDKEAEVNTKMLAKNEVFLKELHEYLELIKKRELKLIDENDTKLTKKINRKNKK